MSRKPPLHRRPLDPSKDPRSELLVTREQAGQAMRLLLWREAPALLESWWEQRRMNRPLTGWLWRLYYAAVYWRRSQLNPPPQEVDRAT